MSSTLAYVTAVARLFKSSVITKGLVNELLTSTDWRDALTILKDRGYINETPSTIDDTEIMLKRRAVDMLMKIRKYSSNVKVASDIVDLYLYLFSLNELEPLITSILTGGERNGNRAILIKDIVDANPQTIDDLANFSKGIINEGIKFALSKSSKKTSNELNSYLEYYFIYKLTKIVSEFRGDWKSKAEDIICGYKDYYSVVLAYRLHEVENIICKLDEGTLKDIASARDEKEVLDLLARTSYAKNLNLENVYEALASLYHISRVKARQYSLDAFMGSPFNPATVLAIAELIRLDYEDLTLILNSIKLGIQEKAKKMLSFELI